MNNASKTIIMIMAVLLLTSCNDINNSDKDGLKAEPPTASNSAIENSSDAAQKVNVLATGDNANWDEMKGFAKFIGMSLFEVANNHGGFDYTWFGDGKQVLKTLDEAFLYFDKPAWKNGTCSAILIDGGSIFPKSESNLTVDKLKSYYGTDFVNTKSEKGREEFEYHFQDYKVVFITNEQGVMKSDEKCVMIISNDEEITPEKIIAQNQEEYALNKKSNRNSPKWDVVNDAISKIGMSMDEIIKNDSSWSLSENEKNVMYSEKQDYRIDLDNSGKAICVEVPLNLLFRDAKTDSITMPYLIDYLGLSFSWGIYEGCGYQIYFDDCSLTIESDEKGDIITENYIYISGFDPNNNGSAQ